MRDSAVTGPRLSGSLVPNARAVFGLDPLAPALAEAWRAIAGDPYRPPVRRGISSLRLFKPATSLPTWLGRRRADGRVPVYNFFNRVRDENERGYSVRVTYARDFLGGRHTYDGHLGTDFAVPVGTRVVAPAPGVVLCVANHFGSGGLKVCIDHGDGLFTTCNHLMAALVSEGETVARGQPIGLSGASGAEFVMFFPWLSPHVHFNTWLDGEPVDPFALPGETPLWRAGNDPTGAARSSDEQEQEGGFRPSRWDEGGVARALETCRDPRERQLLESLESTASRAAHILLVSNYRPTVFSERPKLYAERHERRSILDLPFERAEVSGVAFPA